MVARGRRRYRLADWKALHVPEQPDKDPSLTFPFRETFQNLMSACPVQTAPLRDGKNERPYTYLKSGIERIVDVEKWLASMSRFVVCRDLLAVSMAVDFDRERGDPSQPQTLVAQLRARAKPYDHEPTDDCYAAATHLAAELLQLVEVVEAYSAAELIVSMPPSSPAKAYDLPRLLAGQLAARWNKPDGGRVIRTTTARRQVKNLPLSKKLDALEGTFEIEVEPVRGRTVLVVDDLYQSGASMNFVAMKLLELGARAVLGLAAEKTCRNDDNQVQV